MALSRELVRKCTVTNFPIKYIIIYYVNTGELELLAVFWSKVYQYCYPLTKKKKWK